MQTCRVPTCMSVNNAPNFPVVGESGRVIIKGRTQQTRKGEGDRNDDTAAI